MEGHENDLCELELRLSLLSETVLDISGVSFDRKTRKVYCSIRKQNDLKLLIYISLRI